jgi:hypothetical protein
MKTLSTILLFLVSAVFLTTSSRAFADVSASPGTIKRGDKVIVVAEGTRLVLGDQIVSIVPRDQQLTVLEVHGSWIGTTIETDAGEKKGWIQSDQLVTPGQLTRATALQKACDKTNLQPQVQQVESYRIIDARTECKRSYRSSGYKNSAALDPPYMYQKTDPRRHQSWR